MMICGVLHEVVYSLTLTAFSRYVADPRILKAGSAVRSCHPDEISQSVLLAGNESFTIGLHQLKKLVE